MLKSLIKNLKPPVQQSLRASDPDFIDVKRLIAELSDDDLMASADAYFQSMTLGSEQCRKPFSNPNDSVHLTRHLSLVLEAADVFRGARVLEVGCGTGWLTLGLAQMGCDAVGVDISPAAIGLAQGLLDRCAGEKTPGQAAFTAYDGKTLPLPDASVDRLICYDAFHHVRDQAATLKEFARVLKDGGRAAFLEPGPHHSKTPMSQAEMARHKVIENDVVMAEVTAHALAAGFDQPQMLVQFQQPFTLSVEEFGAWAEQGIPRERGEALLRTLQQQMTNGQCFFLYKGQPTRDSRRADGLAGRLELVSARHAPLGAGRGIHLEVRATNTGSRDWISAKVPGQVNLGVHLLAADGSLLNNNFGRVRLPGGTVAAGQSVVFSGTVPLPQPAGDAGWRLRLDLVAELVAWFSDVGKTHCLDLPRSDIAG